MALSGFFNFALQRPGTSPEAREAAFLFLSYSMLPLWVPLARGGEGKSGRAGEYIA